MIENSSYYVPSACRFFLSVVINSSEELVASFFKAEQQFLYIRVICGIRMSGHTHTKKTVDKVMRWRVDVANNLLSRFLLMDITSMSLFRGSMYVELEL